MYNRLLNITLPEKQSAFLWGARQTGKSTYLKKHFPEAVIYDLLNANLYQAWMQAPWLLRQEILGQYSDKPGLLFIIDEIQKIPQLLDEVHWLIENTHHQFILCGSSARKLKRTGVNLLGGRAWGLSFYPLTSQEIPGFDLLRALNHGLIPKHYDSDEKHLLEHVNAYTNLYLTEEIMREALVRDIPAFSRFIDALKFCNGELINYSNVARDCGINSKTVKEYFQIAVDTLVGYLLEPYKKNVKREVLLAKPKFYFFDVGIITALKGQKISALAGREVGKAFEHFILMELIAYNGLISRSHAFYYWRTKSGLEVDFIIGEAEVAIEVKLNKLIQPKDVKGIFHFLEEFPEAKGYAVCQCDRAYLLEYKDKKVMVLPWNEFLKMLWNKKIIQ